MDERASEVHVSVPDRGGMMDSVPRDAEQLAWAEKAFAEVPGVQRIWPTVWQLPVESLPALRAIIEHAGGSWQEESLDA